jgi:hypothetical protein
MNPPHYRTLQKIGAARRGEVHLTQDTTLARSVAIKFLNDEITKDRRTRRSLNSCAK